MEGGIKWESDIDQIRVNILSCEQQKTGLQTDRAAYIRMLSLLTGQDLTGQTFVEPQIEATTSMEIKRPELGLYDAQAQQVAAQKKQLNASRCPRFNFTVQAGYGRPSLNMLSGEFNPYVIAGIKMQWNLGSLYTFKNDRRKTELDSRKLDYARESFILNTSVEAIQKQSLENDLARYSKLLANNAATGKQVDDIKDKIALLKAQMDAQTQSWERNNTSVESEIRSTGIQLEQKKDQLAKCKITSPISGTVLTRYAEAGENVTAGKPDHLDFRTGRVHAEEYPDT